MSRIVISLVFLAFSTFFGSLSAAPLKVGLVLDKGGKDDKSFNASAYKGASEAQKNLGIQLKVVESSDDAAIEPALRNFAQRGFDLVIGIGFVMADPMNKMAKEFPKTKFLLVDAPAKQPNIRSVSFKEHEGAYLVGAIAALASKTGTVGFIGGMDIPLIRRFELAYRAGVQSIAPKGKVITNYVGASSDAWRNPTRGKELATSQINKKADVIFAAAGASALGVFDAVEEHKKFVIGCDSNQNWIKPGLVLTSMLKRIDLAVYETIELLKNGKFEGGHREIGVKEGAIDYAMDENNKVILTAAIQKKADEIKAGMLKGSIPVPDYYKKAALE